ncbi:tuzin, putative [Leishmania guyanensis]
MVKWIRDAGVHCVSCVKRSVRLLVLEGAEWQRDHHAELRALQRERAWRCFIQRYSGFVSAYWAALGVLSVLLWNFKSCGRHPRSFQVKRAVSTLTDTGHQHSSSPAEPPPFVERAAEKSCARQVLRQPGITHPRIAVLTGVRGRGRNSLLRLAVRKEHTAALFVEVRGGEATLSCTVKAMKMPNLECCGDHWGAIADTFTKAAKVHGERPIWALTLREGCELSRVYNESAPLASDRRLCHLAYEAALESLTTQHVLLPRLGFSSVPNFTARQALQCTEHAVDATPMVRFLEVMGTHCSDIDEVLAAVRHRGVSVVDYIDQRLLRAMRQAEAAWASSGTLRAAVKRLAEEEHYVGQQNGPGVLRDAELKGIVLYDPVHDRWMLTHKAHHTAARCCL